MALVIGLKSHAPPLPGVPWHLPGWLALAAVAAVTWALVIYETTAWSDTRRLIRDEHGMPGQDAAVDSPSQNPADDPEV